MCNILAVVIVFKEFFVYAEINFKNLVFKPQGLFLHNQVVIRDIQF